MGWRLCVPLSLQNEWHITASDHSFACHGCILYALASEWIDTKWSTLGIGNSMLFPSIIYGWVANDGDMTMVQEVYVEVSSAVF